MFVLFSKLLKLAFPLFKEYLTSSLKEQGKTSYGLKVLAQLIVVVWLTIIINYLVEQASLNLSLHEPLIKQYGEIYKRNREQAYEISTLRSQMVEKDALIVSLTHTVMEADPSASPPVEFIYDTHKHEMIVRPTPSDNKKQTTP